MENKSIYNAAKAEHDFAQSELDLIAIEISLALTFLEVARTSQNEETKKRNHMNARKAHDEAVIRINRHHYTNEEEQCKCKAGCSHASIAGCKCINQALCKKPQKHERETMVT